MNKNEIKKIRRINELLIEKFGIPKSSKKLPDPVDLLIATILSQNTNDQNSFKAYKNLKNKFPNWENLLKVTRVKIENEIKVAGLGKQKSQAIKDFIDQLYASNGKISLNYLKRKSDEDVIEELTKFKGIGVKTASCVLLFAMNRNVCPVDTHVHRTLNRIGMVKTNSPDKTFEFINNGLPENPAHSFHTNLIRLGREICKPKNPACSVCPLKKFCKFEHKNDNTDKRYKLNDFMLLDNVGN